MTDTWESGPSLPAGVLHHAVTIGSDGTIYAIGGYSPSLTPSDVVYKLAPDASSWDTAPSLPAARHSLAAATGSDGTIYAIGGNNGGPKADVYTLTPGASSWTTGVALPDTRSGAGSATTSAGTIYVIGGSNSATVSILAPGDTSWTAGPDLPAARNQAAAAIRAGVLFEVGGDSGGLTGQAAVYTLAVDVDTTPPGPVSDLSSPGGIALAWANPTDTDFAGVMIRRMEGADAPANATDGDLVSSVGAAVTSYTDTGVTSGQQYTYALFAYDGHSNYADPVVITATASGAPLAKTTGQIWPRGKR